MVNKIKKTIINGKLVVVDQNRPFFSIANMIRTINGDNNAFTPSKARDIVHGKNMSWPVPKKRF